MLAVKTAVILHSAGANVGLEQTFFREMEDVGVIELCVIVFEPDLNCPIKFPFDISLNTTDGSAGKQCAGINPSKYVYTTLFFFSQLNQRIMEHLM